MIILCFTVVEPVQHFDTANTLLQCALLEYIIYYRKQLTVEILIVWGKLLMEELVLSTIGIGLTILGTSENVSTPTPCYVG